MHAIIELSFMPSWLARNTSTGQPHTIAYYKGIVDPPSNFSAWGDVIYGVVAHLVDRYGIDEIAQWRFEVSAGLSVQPRRCVGAGVRSQVRTQSRTCAVRCCVRSCMLSECMHLPL
jgi:hypothetical protein